MIFCLSLFFWLKLVTCFIWFTSLLSPLYFIISYLGRSSLIQAILFLLLFNCVAYWFCRRCYIRFIKMANESKGLEGQEETRKAFDFMLNYVGVCSLLSLSGFLFPVIASHSYSYCYFKFETSYFPNGIPSFQKYRPNVSLRNLPYTVGILIPSIVIPWQYVLVVQILWLCKTQVRM